VDLEPRKGKIMGRSSPETVSTRLHRIATLARQTPRMVLTTLAHHIDVELLAEAHRRTRKDGAAGVDGQTAAAYAANLGENLQSLLDRFKSGRYKAPPVKRVHIPKGDGRKTRPIGVPTFEDKVLQRAVAMVLEAVYEQDFLPCSYGFRPRRSAHQALQDTWDALMDVRGGWVLEADISSFFDTVSHCHLRSLLDQRVRDGVLRRAVDKWLKAGVLEQGAVWYPDEGTPQGGVISPLLANIYLHEVLDKWFTEEVLPRLRGRAVLIRYADDFVVVFEREQDARQVMAVLPKRFARYGLHLHPDKTRLLDFNRPTGGKPPRGRSFDLLGFTHFWGKSRRGSWVVKRKTASSRLTRAIRKVAQWCRWNRHGPVVEQHHMLTLKVKGHYAYFGITGNGRALLSFVRQVERVWRKWLDRRSNRAKMCWDRFKRLLRIYPLPSPKIVHSVYRQAANP
jgi:RNA-directed DNA polymerase